MTILHAILNSSKLCQTPTQRVSPVAFRKRLKNQITSVALWGFFKICLGADTVYVNRS